MDDAYDQLGLSTGATPAEIKAAYHAKLKQFPAHSHPQEFKALRAAYETLVKVSQNQEETLFRDDFLQGVGVDQASLVRLEQQAAATVRVTLEDLIRLTF